MCDYAEPHRAPPLFLLPPIVVWHSVYTNDAIIGVGGDASNSEGSPSFGDVAPPEPRRIHVARTESRRVQILINVITQRLHTSIG